MIAGALLVAGLLFLRNSLLTAFQWFRRSVLVSLLVVQPLAFYEQQLTAVVGLALNLVLHGTTRTRFHSERVASAVAAGKRRPREYSC